MNAESFLCNERLLATFLGVLNLSSDNSKWKQEILVVLLFEVYAKPAATSTVLNNSNYNLACLKPVQSFYSAFLAPVSL